MQGKDAERLAEAALPCYEVQVHIDNARAIGSTWTLGVVEWGGAGWGILESPNFWDSCTE